jgi:hypothetical protein
LVFPQKFTVCGSFSVVQAHNPSLATAGVSKLSRAVAQHSARLLARSQHGAQAKQIGMCIPASKVAAATDVSSPPRDVLLVPPVDAAKSGTLLGEGLTPAAGNTACGAAAVSDGQEGKKPAAPSPHSCPCAFLLAACFLAPPPHHPRPNIPAEP